MKINQFLTLIILTVIIFSGCFSNKPNNFSESGYHIVGNNVYYHPGFPAEPYVIEVADSRSFVILTDSFGATRFAKDDNNVFVSGGILENADPASFEIVHNGFTKDRSHVFFNQLIFCDDPENFEIVSINMVKDRNHVYSFVNGKDIVSNDPQNFINAGGDYYRDSEKVYFMFSPVDGADLQSFSHLSGTYARDKNNMIYCENIIRGSDIKTFEILPGPYSKDKSKVYFLGKELPQADPSTFNILNEKFQCAHDAQRAYSQGIIVEGLDPATFPKNKHCNNCDENGFYFSN